MAQIQYVFTTSNIFLPRQIFAGLQMELPEGSTPKPAVHWPVCCNQPQDFVCLLNKNKQTNTQHEYLMFIVTAMYHKKRL